MRVLVNYKLVNIAPKFNKVIWTKTNVATIYPSARDAKKHHNLTNCCYQFLDENDNVVRTVDNAKLDAYGRRY